MIKKSEAFLLSIITLLIFTVVGLITYWPRKIETTIPGNVDQLLNKAYQTFQVPREGIIHIGARYAEELAIYKHHNIKNILWIEADTTAEDKLLLATADDPNSKVAFFAATDTNGFIELHRTNNDGHSSSIYKLKNHLLMSPTVLEDKIITVPQRRIDDYLRENPELNATRYNVIVIDVQGAEMISLKGATQTLQNVDAIIAEINLDDLYEGAVHMRDLDDYLIKHDFLRVDTISVTRGYGDALYIKSGFCKYKQIS